MMNENAMKYEGIDRFECCKKIVTALQDMNVLFEIEDPLHQVGHSERSGAVVEPYLSTQWFVNMQPLADRAVELQKGKDKVNFIPERLDRKSTRLNSSHVAISYAVFCLKKKRGEHRAR